MRTDVPPPGRAMTLPEWSVVIVAGVRPPQSVAGYFDARFTRT